MDDQQAFPLRLEKAGITVRVEQKVSGTGTEYCVVFPRNGKQEKERYGNPDEARKRADGILSEILAASYPVELSKPGVNAKVYYTPTSNGYDAYTLVYYRDGKRVREQFGSVDAAKKRGNKVLDGLSRGQIAATVMTLQDVEAYTHAKRHLKGTGVSLESACKEYAELLRLLNGVSPLHVAREYARRHHGEVTNRTVKQVVDEFLVAKREGRSTRLRGNGRKVSEKYLYELERKLHAFAGYFNHPIGMVSSEGINEFITSLKVEGRTKNNYVQAINVLFEFAKKQKYLPRDHDVLDEVESAAEADFVIDIFKPEEMEKLLGHAEPALVPVLAIGAFAGLRTAEIERLDWAEVNLEKRFIEVTAQKAKTRARRLVPVTDNLAAWLRPCAQQAGKVWPHSAPWLFELQREAGKEAKVPWKHNALRHSFISYRLAMVKSVDQVAMEAGNSAQMIFQHYRELVTEESAKAWFGVTPATVKGAKAKMEKEKAEAAQKAEAERLAKVVPMPGAKAA